MPSADPPSGPPQSGPAQSGPAQSGPAQSGPAQSGPGDPAGGGLHFAQRLARLWSGGAAVLERDFLATTSKRRFLVVRLLAALISAIVVAVAAIENVRRPPDDVGVAVFVAAAVVVPLTIALLAPAFAAPCIATEREGGTLDLVLVAPVRPVTLVGAKFLARFLSVATLVLAVTPVAAVCLLYGGISFSNFGALIIFALCLAALGVAAGIVTSAYCRTVSQAILASYLLAFGAPGALTAMAGYAAYRDWFVGADAFSQWLLPSFPGYVWVMLVNGRWAGVQAADLVLTHAVFVAAAVVFLLLLATLRLGREATRPRKRKRRRRSRGILFEHPILDRGVRGSLLRSPTPAGSVISLAGVIVIGFFLWEAFDRRGSAGPQQHVAALGILSLLAMLQMLSTTAGSIASERRRGSLDLLMATPMRSEEIALGSLCATFLAASPLLALGLFTGVVATGLGQFNLGGLGAWSVVTTALMLLCGAIGLRASISARSPTQASLRTFGIFFGGLIALILLIFLMEVSNVADDLTKYIALSMPVVVPFVGTWQVTEILDSSRSSPDLDEFLTTVVATAAYALVGALLALQSAAALEKSRD